MRNRYLRGMAISSFIIIISFFNFTTLEGTESIKSVHIVTLLVAGMGIGVLLANFFAWLRDKRSNNS